MTQPKDLIIKCPKCGCEYLPAEIYYPDKFLGSPYSITKISNEVVFGGDNMNLEEVYECDNCGTTFVVNASVSFNAKIKEEFNFDDEYTTITYSEPRITLEEPRLFEDEE